MNRKLIRYIGTLTLLLAISISTKAQNKVQPLVIADQGIFAIGGTKTTAAGIFNLDSALKPQGQTFHGDHTY